MLLFKPGKFSGLARVKQISPWILVLFFSLSCSSMNTPLHGRAAEPAIFLQKSKPLAPQKEKGKKPEQKEKALGESGKEKGEQVLLELENREKNFNRDLGSFLEKQQKLPVAKETKKEEKTISSSRIPVSFNFDEADLVEVVRLFMDLLQANYTIDPGVGGKVTFQFKGELRKEQLFQLLKGILRTQGAAIVKKGLLYEILPLSGVTREISPGELIFPGGKTPAKAHAIKAFRLRFIAPEELVKIIKPYLSKGAMVYAHSPSGIFLVSDYPLNLRKIGKLVNLFDVSAFAGMKMKVYFLRYVEAETLVKELEGLTKTVGISPGKGQNPNAAVYFLALPRLNLLLSLSRSEDSLKFVDRWVVELDREIPFPLKEEQQQGVFVYYVQNGQAADIIKVLQGLFGKGGEAVKKEEEAEKKLPPARRLLGAPYKRKEKRKKLPTEAVSGELQGPVTFVADDVTNSILTRCSGADYRRISPVIKKLDLYPRQVLIEVVIAEILLDETSKLGVEWKYLMNIHGNTEGSISLDSGLGVISGGAGQIGAGFTYLVTDSKRLTAALKAFADNNQVKILSSPHILASDNKPAKIDVGEEVPIVTSEYRTTEAAATATTVDKTIQYRDVGIILTVTPHINETGMVRMDVTQEVSEVSKKTVEGIESPVFAKRIADTSLSVKDSQTIVIGGLIQQNRSDVYTGVPFLGRIPLLKYLFGYRGKEFHSTELMILITPKVIKSQKDSSFVSSGFIKRLREVKQKMMEW